MGNDVSFCLKRTLVGSSAGFLASWIFTAYWFNGANNIAVIHEIAGLLFGAIAGLLSAFISRNGLGRIFLLDKDTVIVDVREREEYEAGHIPSSISIPLAEISQSDLSFLNEDKKLIVYCTSGIRSAKAARLLRKKGVKGVVDFSGGIRVWLKSGGRLDFELNNNTGGSYV